MAIIRNLKETIQVQALQDSDFSGGFLTESIENILAGDIDTGKFLHCTLLVTIWKLKKMIELVKIEIETKYNMTIDLYQ